ncbi:MAG: LCP family protein [Firmicutes bacterium]|nr:LCP family protein [Bacillota bacterium]
MRKKRGSKLGCFFLVLLLAMLAVLAGGTGWVWSVWAQIHEPENEVEIPSGQDEIIVEEEDKDLTNILILGLDQRGTEKARADTIIVLSINNATKEMTMLSIPRDSRVEIPGRGLDKINHAYAYGGVSLMRATVEKLLGVPVHHYVVTNFSGFVGLVDTLGGVTLDVERSIYVKAEQDYPAVKLEPGEQRLTGYEALAYVRFRKDSEGDFGRMRRQQQFLQAVAKEVLQAKSLLKLPQLARQATEYLRTDLPLTKALSLAQQAASLNLDSVETITLQGTGRTIGGVSYVVLDEAFLENVVQTYLRPKDTDPVTH